jgi:hypothetical protein
VQSPHWLRGTGLPAAPRRFGTRKLTVSYWLPLATLAAAAATTATTATAAAAATAKSPAATASPASTATALAHWPRFVDNNVAPFELLAIQRLDGPVCLFVILNLDKTEAPRLTRETIANKGHIRRRYTCLREPFSNFFF